jgi:hypothetical protein
MAKFSVWYQREFRSSLKVRTTWNEDEFVSVGKFIATDLEDLFALLNDGLEVGNPLGSQERQEFIRAQRIHTSMSVGDVAVDLETGQAYIVAPFGFSRVEKLEMADQ